MKKTQSAFDWWDNLPDSSMEVENKKGLAYLLDTTPENITIGQIKLLHKIRDKKK